jgi:transposase
MFWKYCASRQRPYQDAHCPHSPCERQIKEANHQLDALTVKLIPAEDAGAGQQKQHDGEILASLPGVGRIVLATLLAEAWDTLLRRDYAALRSLAGVAPVTKKSGKTVGSPILNCCILSKC